MKDHCCTEEIIRLFYNMVTEKSSHPRHGAGMNEMHIKDDAAKVSESCYNYICNRIFNPDVLGAIKFCDAYIVGEREGVRTANNSEIYHNAINSKDDSIRAECMPICVERLFLLQEHADHKNYMKYADMFGTNRILLPKYSLEFAACDVSTSRYSTLMVGAQEGIMKPAFECSDFKQHRIKI